MAHKKTPQFYPTARLGLALFSLSIIFASLRGRCLIVNSTQDDYFGTKKVA